MYRLAYRIYRLWTGLLRWVTRRFTPAGRALLGGLVVAAIAGVDVEVSLTHQLFCLLLAVLLVALLGSIGFQARFAAERILPRFGSVGLPLSYHLVLRNESGRFQKGLLVMDELADHRPTLAEFTAQIQADDRQIGSFRLTKAPQKMPRDVGKVKEAEVPALPPGGETEVMLELLPLRRGVVRFTGLSVGRPDPLGLYKAQRRQPLPGTVLILPKRYFIPALALPGTHKYQQGGVALAASIGESEEFVSLRDYRPGDPLRRIHWKSWAKAGKPIVKEYQDEFFVRHALVLDTFSDAPDSRRFEEAVSVAASFACAVETQESLLDLLFVGAQAYCFTVGRGVAHTEQMLEVLAGVRACLDRPFEDLRDLVLNHAGLVSGCILVLLQWDDPRQELVRRLKLLQVPLRVLVVAEEGQAGKIEPGLMRDQPGVFQVLETGKVEEGLARLGGGA